MVHQWILEDTEKLDPGSWSPMEILEAKFEANLIISILMLVDISWIFESQWRSEKKTMDFLIFFQYLSVMEWEKTAKESCFSSTMCLVMG